MDFSKPANAPVGEGLPAKLDPVAEPAGEKMLVTQPVMGPADSRSPECPNPLAIEAPGIAPGALLVAELNWAVPRGRAAAVRSLATVPRVLTTIPTGTGGSGPHDRPPAPAEERREVPRLATRR